MSPGISGSAFSKSVETEKGRYSPSKRGTDTECSPGKVPTWGVCVCLLSWWHVEARPFQ